MKQTINSFKFLNKFAASTFVTSLLRFGLRLIKNVIFTRLLGPHGRGMYSLLITVPTIIANFGQLGFGIGNIYLVTKKKCNFRRIFGNALFFSFVVSPALVFSCYLLFKYEIVVKSDAHEILKYLPCVLFSVPLVYLNQSFQALILSIKKIHLLNFLELFLSGFSIIFFLIFIVFIENYLLAAISAWILSWLFMLLFSTFFLRKKIFPVRISWPFFKTSIQYGIRVYVSSFATEMVRRVDILFIAKFLGPVPLGYYAVSVSLAEILLSLPDAFNIPFIPLRFGMNSSESKNFAPVVIRHIMSIMFFVCLITVFLGKPIIWILFGKSFEPSYIPLLLLLPGILFLSIYNFLKIDLFSHERPGFVSMVTLFSCGSNIILNFLLIPSLGINGAAISTSICYFLSSFLLLRKFVQISNYTYREVLVIKRSDIQNIISFIKEKMNKS